MTPHDLLKKHGIEESDLLSHWEAWRNVTLYSSEKKLNSIPEARRKTIAEFYDDIRKAGFYPIGPDGESMKFTKTRSPVPGKPPKVEKIDSSNCKFGDCHKCRVVIYQDTCNCKTRTAEWQKAVNQIMAGWPRKKGEGTKMANDFIDYMKNDFMGGIYPPSTPGPKFNKQELQEDIPF
jgi:hypothetical protein